MTLILTPLFQERSERVARIGIYGSGTVGRATGVALQAIGHICIYTDSNEAVIARLTHQGLDARPLYAMRESATEISMVCVPTPFANGAMSFTALDAVAEDLGQVVRQCNTYHVVVVRSTVLPGATLGRLLPRLVTASGRKVDQEFGLAVCPEFLREATAEEDARAPWAIVIGASAGRAAELLRQVYAPLTQRMGCPILLTDIATAEYAKCVSNAFNAVKISFFNEMARLAPLVGAGSEQVGEIVAHTAEGMWNPRYGIRAGTPFGGQCLEKDAHALLALAASLNVDLTLLGSAMRVNEALRGNGAAASS